MSTLDSTLNAFFMTSPGEYTDDPYSTAQRAIVCALKLQTPMNQWALKNRKVGEIQVGIVISTGMATVGVMGSPKRQNLNVHGCMCLFSSRIGFPILT